MSKARANYTIRSRHQMRALAAPTRQEIVDVLPGMGTVSVAELAKALGRPADSLYYHLRALKKVGLVLGAGSRIRNGRPEALFRAVAPQMTLRYESGKDGNAAEINPIIASMMRIGTRDFRRAFHAGKAVVSGPHRELWALRNTGWLSRKQIAQVNRCIEKIRAILARTKRNGRLHAVTVLLTPLDRQAGMTAR